MTVPRASCLIGAMSALDAALGSLDTVLKKMKRRPKRGKPASAEAIAKLERAWKIALPPSYRALLAQCDGYADRASDPTIVGLLPLKELTPPSRLAREAEEWKHADPDCAEAKRGFVIGRTLDAWTLLDPGARRGEELGVVTIDSEMEVESHVDLAAYLAACAKRALAEAESNAFSKASMVRSKQIEAAGAVIEGLRATVVSPDGARLAGLSGGAIVVFDLAGRATKEGVLYAPVVHRIEGTMGADWATERLAFSDDGATLVRVQATGTTAFDAATGAPRPATTHVAEPGKIAFKIADRFRKRDGVRLTPVG